APFERHCHRPAVPVWLYFRAVHRTSAMADQPADGRHWLCLGWRRNGARRMTMPSCRNQRLVTVGVIGAVSLCTEILAAIDVHAPTPSPPTEAASASPINLGGREWSASESSHAVSGQARRQLEFEVRGGLVSD